MSVKLSYETYYCNDLLMKSFTINIDPGFLKDTLKDFGDFKNKQQKYMK